MLRPMSEHITFPSSAGPAPGYLALPAGAAQAPAVVLIQEYWGINDNIQDKLADWAKEGFIALAPDLYHGYLAKTAEEAGARMGQLDWGRAIAEIAGAVEFVRTHARSTGKVALTGYCMGGALTLRAACEVRGLAAVVPFYGLPGDAPWAKVDAPVLGHFATRDTWATVSGAEQVKQAIEAGGGSMELQVYEADHAFSNARRPDVYNPEAAALAWQRTVAFVRGRV